MLIAALIFFVMNSAGELASQNLVDQVGSYIDKSIEETSRQETLQAVVDVIKKEQVKMALQSNSTMESLIELDKDYASKRGQFETLFDEFNRNQQNSYKTMLELRFQLKESMTREEWKEAFSGN